MGTRPTPVPLAIAHRGGAGLAPENTMAAFGLAVGLGLRHLETDVRATRDGRLALLHDARLHRVADLEIAVRDCTWADLGRMPVFGEHRIPQLPELLSSFPDVEVTVDLKDRRAVAPLARLLQVRSIRDRVWVAGAHDGLLAAVRDSAPGVRTALGWRSLARLVVAARLGSVDRLRLPPAEYAHVPARLLRDGAAAGRLVEVAAAHGLGVIAWTLQDPPAIAGALDAGAAGVISDRPDVLREVLIGRGQWTPMGRRRRAAGT